MENMEGYRVASWIEEGGLVRRIADSFSSVEIAISSVLAGAAIVLAASATNADVEANATASAAHAFAAMRAATRGLPLQAMQELRDLGSRIESRIANLGNPDESDLDPALLAAVSAHLSQG